VTHPQKLSGESVPLQVQPVHMQRLKFGSREVHTELKGTHWLEA
jgi:hypothetical protein